MEKQLRKMEEILDHSLDRVLEHPAFLSTVSSMINFNSYRKILTRRALETLWKDLELPVKRDQERILLSLQELQIRMQKMQTELRHKDLQIKRLKVIDKRKKQTG